MGFFSKFKMLFNKSISILPHQRGDLVAFVKLRNGMLKIGSDLVVEKDFNLVIVHYNKVCDILREGVHKVDEVSVPRLFKYSKAYFTKKGLFTPNSVKADAYFVNLKPIKHNIFKTPERIIAYDNDEKVKIRLDGNFTLQVVDAEKLMKTLCDDYAIIRNKKTMKEIRSTIGFDVSKILNGKDFSIADYMANKEKIVETINQEINSYIEKYGLHASEFFINQVILPKRYVMEKANEKKQQENNDEQIDIVKIVEDRLNSIEKDLNIVYKTPNSVETYTVKPNVSDGVAINVGGNSKSQSAQTSNSQKNSNSSLTNDSQDEDIILSDNRSNTQSSSQVFSMPYGQENSSFNTSTSSADQPAPGIIKEEHKPEFLTAQTEVSDEFIDGMIDKIEKRKKQKKRERVAEILNQATMTVGQANSAPILNIKPKKIKKCSQCGNSLAEDAKFCSKCGKSTEELIVCDCCGAKNFPNAQTCCVCKSKLG